MARGTDTAEIRRIVSAQVAEWFPRRDQECPRCGCLTSDGLVVTLNGPFRGVRCQDCWEAEG